MGHVGCVALQRELEWPQRKHELQNGVEGLETEGTQIHRSPNRVQARPVEKVTALRTDPCLVSWNEMLKEP